MYPIDDADTHDTGKKWKDANGVVYRILRKRVSCAALPNNTTKNVAHGETVDPAKMVAVVGFSATKGDASAGLTQMTALVSVTVDATNIKLTTTADQTAYVRSEVVIEWAV